MGGQSAMWQLLSSPSLGQYGPVSSLNVGVSGSRLRMVKLRPGELPYTCASLKPHHSLKGTATALETTGEMFKDGITALKNGGKSKRRGFTLKARV